MHLCYNAAGAYKIAAGWMRQWYAWRTEIRRRCGGRRRIGTTFRNRKWRRARRHLRMNRRTAKRKRQQKYAAKLHFKIP
jgi:hypothetical protein